MRKKLDKIDLRILYELDVDCRQPISNIAKKIRKSSAYVKYRINRLKEEKVIQSVSVLVDFPKGVYENYGFIRLKGSGVIEEKLLLDFLFKMPETYRLYWCDGKYEIIASFLVKDLRRLNEIKNILVNNFSNIEIIFFHTVADSKLSVKNYLVGELDQHMLSIGRDALEPEQLSKQIVIELQRNPFASLLEISTVLGISYDRIKYLFKTALPYKGMRLVLGESNQKVKKAILFLDVVKRTEEIMEHAAYHPNVVQTDNLVGEYNFVLYFECFADQEIQRIIKEFLYQFKDAIANHIRIDIVNTYKYRAVNL
ncbi:MAG: Lrp/AsnC family transcriptional regulator [Candidatus Micrarchaeota archaeon]|nr:Lrp/AsnC family transcriptional regulator [Candidatus Micrarchaeota archaeon]